MNNYFTELPHLSLLTVSGADAGAFLHAQFTLDLRKLPAEQSALTGWCNPKGRVLANFLIWRHGEQYDLLLPADQTVAIHQRLQMFVLRAQVSIEARADHHAMGICGAQALDKLQASLGNLPGADWNCIHTDVLTLLRLPGAEPRCLVIGPAADLQPLCPALESVCPRGTASDWMLADIQAGLPWITAAIREQFLPQSLHLDRFDGLAYDKGCYPGQEVIARLHYRGEIKQRLRRGTTATLPEPGTPLYTMAGDRDGTVVNATAIASGSRVLVVAGAAGEQRHLHDASGGVVQLDPGWL